MVFVKEMYACVAEDDAFCEFSVVTRQRLKISGNLSTGESNNGVLPIKVRD